MNSLSNAVIIGTRSGITQIGGRLARLTAIVSALLSAACHDASGPPDAGVSPSTGAIRLTLSMSGEDVPVSYSISVAGPSRRSQSAPPRDTVLFGGLAPGEYRLTLVVASNCRVDGDNPRAATVVVGKTTTVTFSATCGASHEKLRVTTVTTGADLDPDGYQLRVEARELNGQRYQESWSLSTNGVAVLSAVPIGQAKLTLTGLSVNCDATDASQRTVDVPDADTVAVTFTIVCAPDTGQLAYVVGAVSGGRHIWLINVNRSGARRLTEGMASDEDPAWSPDGEQLAFVTDRDGNREIYVSDGDGSNARRLTNDPAADYQPTWSPDGHRIAFVSERSGNPEIFAMDADGANLARLTISAAAEANPAWAPDGRIAFTSQRDTSPDIYVMNSDGSGTTRLTTGALQPAWSPDGTRLAYAARLCSYYTCYSAIVVTPNTQPSDAFGLTPAEQPTWSPDGRKIAFTSLDCDFYFYSCVPSAVKIGRLDGTMEVISLTVGSHPAWRP